MTDKNNKKIGFIVDSSSNLKDGQIEDVAVLPLNVTVQQGDVIKMYKDGLDFNNLNLRSFVENGAIVKTSQATMSDMLKIVQKMCAKYDEVYVFPIHTKLSSNINTWLLLKEDFPRLNVVMTYDISYSFAWTIKEVKNFLQTNNGGEENVQKFVNEHIIPNRFAFLMIKDLEQLKKGGRVSGIKAALAKLFNIKPVVLFDQNGLTNFDKVKEYEDLFQMQDAYITEKYGNKTINKFMLFVPLDDEQIKTNFIHAFEKHYPGQTYELIDLPAVVVAHTGIKYAAMYVNLK